MDGKKRILELEGMVAGLREYAHYCSKSTTPSIPYKVKQQALGDYSNTQSVAEAHDARVERRGRALGLREAAKTLDFGEGILDFISVTPALWTYKKDPRKHLEAQAEKIEKEEGL